MGKSSRTLYQVYKELVSHPFFPLLFIGEAVKTAIAGGPLLEFTILALVATIMWALSDSVEVDVSISGENGFVK